jgi:N-acetylmuramic acid 6-phosphate (MurNAc-6-P) etherase
MIVSAVCFEVPERMPVRSKWQSLPTEQINPSTLAIDKLSARRHRRGDAERRPQDARGGAAREGSHRGRRRHHHQRAAQGGRIVFVGAGTSGRLGVLESAEMPPTFGTSRRWCRRSWPAARTRCCKRAKGVEDNYEEGARSVNRLRPTKKDVVIGVSASGMTQFVRGALTRRAAARVEDHLRHLRSANRAADVRRSDDRARPWAGSHRRLDAAEGGHGDEDGAQHADHGAMIRTARPTAT